MRLRSLALAAIPAAFLGVMASAPAASAWAPGNCQTGTFCVWPEYWYGDTDMQPSLVTDRKWSGSAVGHIFYNYTSQDVTMTYVVIAEGEQGPARTACVSSNHGSYFTQPMYVTDIAWREDDGSPCW
ncbi:hypothetical protein GCM10017779_45430 [Streptomyces capillispiralis]|uniref:Peptidase inhibitor family I36 n=2 Tax=Streptomyces capillispiralis TaxID=68182 RepID=A0A561TRM0_9ACTN|nr:hypothetical protein FHX78_116804 [Streptomyces capillispiralis]GHH94086.1 hypothetical protein GCM10017779_45430 [Streptomyces capillispiralis]